MGGVTSHGPSHPHFLSLPLLAPPLPAAHFLFLDLASLASVRRFVREFRASGLPLHVLVNNGEWAGFPGRDMARHIP